MSSISVLKIVAKAESDLVVARFRTRQMAMLAGICELESTRLTTAVSEITRNAIKYAGEARVEFNVAEENNKQYLQIVVSDHGPGMPSDWLMSGIKRSGGISAAQRLVDDLKISSTNGAGTSAELYKLLPANRKKVCQKEIQEWIIQLKNDSPFSVVEDLEQQNKQLIDTLEELERYREKLEEKTEQLNQANKYKAEFLANMSHEIRTPMNAVIGMSNILDRTELNNEQRKYIRLIKHAGTSLLDIINDILDFSKIEAGKLTIESLEFELFEHVETCVELLSTNAHSKQLALLCWIAPEIPATVYGDSVRVRQILVNLINNAIKFTKEGQVLLQVSILEDRESEVLLRFEVADTGIGLSEEQRKKLFQPFVQADGSTTRQYGGTGLGLSISKQLVDLMKGRIGVESVLGSGSTFWFELPFSKVKDKLQAPLPQLPFKKALIVDDHPSMCEIASALLKAWNVDSHAVANSSEALKMIEEEKNLDLFILDYLLPDMDGLQLTTRLRELPQHKYTPIVLLTALHEGGLGEKAIAAGCDAFLTKPLRQGLFLQCLGSFEKDSAGHLKSTMNFTSSRSLSEAKETASRNNAGVGAAAAAGANASTGQSPTSIPSTNSRASTTPPKTDTSEFAEQPRAVPARTVLLVEDNPTNQIVAEIELKNLDCKVVIAGNGEEALEILERQKFSLAFMDCQMPGMDGYEATKCIRTAEAKTGKHLPIIAMTANAMAGDREKCLAAGMDDYISKPFEPETLRLLVDKWMLSSDCASAPCDAETEAVIHASAESTNATSHGDKSSSGNGVPALDIEKLRGRFNAAQAKQLLSVFLTDTESKLPELNKLVEAKNAIGLSKIAHSIKGAASMIFAEGLAQSARELELAGKKDADANFSALVQCINLEFNRLKAAAESSLSAMP